MPGEYLAAAGWPRAGDTLLSELVAVQNVQALLLGSDLTT